MAKVHLKIGVNTIQYFNNYNTCYLRSSSSGKLYEETKSNTRNGH